MILKPNLTFTVLNNINDYKTYISNNYLFLAIYVFLVIIIQFIVNSSIISSNCGGNITENMGAAGFITFLPWIFIFGALVLILTIYPGFKSAFSDVVGYYYVSSSANKLLTELLIDKDIENKISDDPNMTTEKKEALESAADAIIKICGNNSILINQIVPSNFNNYWSILKPLMKDKYQTDNTETEQLKNQLFDLVVTRDNIGEAMWYIYTGLLLTSIVQLKITTRGCLSNPTTMENNYKKFLDQEQQLKNKQQKTENTYVITG
jgi:hypothetical protein